MAGVPIGDCRTFAKLGSQPQSWTSLECKAQPGNALSLVCLPNLEAQLLLLVRNTAEKGAGTLGGWGGLCPLNSLGGPFL